MNNSNHNKVDVGVGAVTVDCWRCCCCCCGCCCVYLNGRVTYVVDNISCGFIEYLGELVLSAEFYWPFPVLVVTQCTPGRLIGLIIYS